jgi:hypothetical protein
MLKTIGRLLVILLICSLVAVGIYWFVQHNPSALGAGTDTGFEGQRRFEGNFQNQVTGVNASRLALLQNGQAGASRLRERGLEGRFSPGQASFGILRNIGIFALITILVAGVQKVFSRLFHKRPARMV